MTHEWETRAVHRFESFRTPSGFAVPSCGCHSPTRWEAANTWWHVTVRKVCCFASVYCLKLFATYLFELNRVVCYLKIFSVTLCFYPILSYFYIWGTRYTVAGFDNTLWPARFVGFGIGMIVYAIGVSYFFNEGITTKTAISLSLALALICIQVLWK